MLAFFVNKKRKRQSQIYSIIVDADSETIPMQNIMSALQMDFSTVSKDINAMSINGNYPLLRNSHIDIGKQILVISKDRLEICEYNSTFFPFIDKILSFSCNPASIRTESERRDFI